jgi:hypothetical protein
MDRIVGYFNTEKQRKRGDAQSLFICDAPSSGIKFTSKNRLNFSSKSLRSLCILRISVLKIQITY